MRAHRVGRSVAQPCEINANSHPRTLHTSADTWIFRGVRRLGDALGRVARSQKEGAPAHAGGDAWAGRRHLGEGGLEMPFPYPAPWSHDIGNHLDLERGVIVLNSRHLSRIPKRRQQQHQGTACAGTPLPQRGAHDHEAEGSTDARARGLQLVPRARVSARLPQGTSAPPPQRGNHYVYRKLF